MVAQHLQTAAREMKPAMAGEMTFADLTAALRARWWWLLAATLIGFAGAVGYDKLATPIYRADAVLAPSNEGRASGTLSSLAGELGGLAALGGLSLGGNHQETEVGVATLQSRALIERYVADKGLLPVLFASKWDKTRATWKNPAPKKEPTLWDASQMFRSRILSVNLDRLTGLVTVSAKWTDAALAAQWVNDLVNLTNASLRRNAMDEAERNISYLEQQQKKVTEIAVSDSISRLLEDQIKTEMLAQGNQEYAFRVIDPALPPRKPEWPPKALLALGGAFIGFLIGALTALSVGAAPTRKRS